jgi:hypothetical protein
MSGGAKHEHCSLPLQKAKTPLGGSECMIRAFILSSGSAAPIKVKIAGLSPVIP